MTWSEESRAAALQARLRKLAKRQKKQTAKHAAKSSKKDLGRLIDKQTKKSDPNQGRLF